MQLMKHGFAILLLLRFAAFAVAETGAHERYAPSWADIQPLRVLQHTDSSGDALVKAVEALQPGDRLEIAAGTYSVNRMWDIRVSGTKEAPIWIVAADGAQVIITRPDDKQNVLNVGQGGPVEFVCLRGLEITGGSHGLRLGQCQNTWVDQCHIHHTGQVCLSANSADTSHLYLTRNHCHDGCGHGEGMYLGANKGQYIMSESVIALNHIHDCGGLQGDGIEVKQGSWGNLIAGNHIHDTQYPCITVYGTAGKPVNIIERNLCYRSGDHVMQVQGEAIVRNNVLIAAKGSGFASTDHQGQTVNLQVLHNTIINTGKAFSGGSWNGREGMVLANNILLSRDAEALHFANGQGGVRITGNVVSGLGLQDFVSLTWDAESHDATPTAEAPFEGADPEFLLETDFNGAPRTQPVSGAISP